MNMHTEAIIAWSLSAPVLTKRLVETIQDDFRHGHDELVCLVVDLLCPQRSPRTRAFLFAAGVRLADADAVWARLSGGDVSHWKWADIVDWDAVREVLLHPDIYLPE